MLIEIDVWLLGKLERFSHWFQKLTGKNCFWLAKIAAIFHGLLIVVILMSGVFLGNQAIAIVSGIMVMFAFFVVFKHFALIKHRERVVLSTQEKSLSNPFKVLDYDCRAIVLFIILLCFFIMAINLIGYFLFYFGAMLAFLMFLQGLLYYFSACDPLPPAKSKVKEWKEKFVNAVKGVFAPAPRPIPAPCE